GYTGQEALDAVQLDDYNARLYDPKLGRFLSVDPLIAHPESTQGINPYSYVENNPLNATDPTGKEEVSGNACTMEVCHNGGQWSDIHNSVSGADWNVTAVYSNGTSITGSITQMAKTSLSQLNQIANNLPGGSALTFGANGAASITHPNSTNGTNVGAHNFTNKDGDSRGARPPGMNYYDPVTNKWMAHEPGIESVCIVCLLPIGRVAEGVGLGVKVVEEGIEAAEPLIKAAGTELSTLRYTQEGETFLRYESGNPAFTRVTEDGGLKPGTYAAPSEEGIRAGGELNSRYNLPGPGILRTSVFEIRPPPGTPIIGPRPVGGGLGSEVEFPFGVSPGSVGSDLPVPWE
ncbi:MAG: RHS repeat-associated core domain-containing protein, partial [Candidatus Saccharimonadales bacterium]